MNNSKKRVAILGSTGSIGKQALEVIQSHPDEFVAELLVANSNADLLIQQAIAYSPDTVIIADKEKYLQVKDALSAYPVKVYAGTDAIAQCVQLDNIDVVLAAIVGYAGLESTLAAVKAGKTIALANKETLVVAGEMITELARKNGVNIFPVDSEHSAIFQCMAGEWENKIEKIYLTASGGPFLGKTFDQLYNITPEQALRHPNWSMGAKITIDSATLMNKGLEVIEAKWLFGLHPDKIDVIVHPQSIIHSLVQFEDGSVKAQLGLPDMKLPIQYALGYPKRIPSNFKRFSFTDYPQLTFSAPDKKTFKCLSLAYEAMLKGGNAPCILNAANEVAVEAFLSKRAAFTDIPEIIMKTMNKADFIIKPDYSDYVESDRHARSIAAEYVPGI